MRVLVVEDEKRLAFGLRRGLEAEDFAPDVVLDGTLGPWMAQEQSYDLVLLNLLHPGISADQVDELLRTEGIWKPMVVLNAKDGMWDQIRTLTTGADDDDTTQPPSLLVVLARVRTRSGRGAEERLLLLEAGDLCLDPLSRKAWRAGCEISLTPREFAVLEYLLRHKGEVSSRRDVLEHVWDDNFHGDPNIVEVYIRRLRVKVDHAFARHAIETVRGSGYRLSSGGG